MDPSTFEHRFKHSLSNIKEAIDRFPNRIVFAVGNKYDDLFSIYLSYEEARELSERKELYDDDDTLWFSGSHQNRAIYYYPMNIELRLINLVKAGMVEQSGELFDYIVSRNIDERSLSAQMRTQLCNELLGTYFKILEQVDHLHKPDHGNVPDPTSTISQAGSAENFRAFRDLFLNICTYYYENRKYHGKKRRSAIIEFIGDRYDDKMLGLSAISNHFRLSESYFSRFFKEQFGETFSSYLERYRIDLAKQLLVATDFSVDMISHKTGYCNCRSFRRAFKRINGINPKSYRSANDV